MTFKKSLLTYGVADIISKSIGLITSPINTRLFTMSQYGAAPLLSAVWTPFALIQFGGFDWAYSFFLVRQRSENDRRRLIANASLFAYLSVLLVWIVFLIFAFSTEWLTGYASVTQRELAFFALGLMPTALIYWLCYLLRFLHQAYTYVKITLLGRILPMVMVLPLLPWIEQENRLLISFAGSFLVSCIALLYALYEIRRMGQWPFSLSQIDLGLAKEMFRYAIVLVPGSAAYALIVITDRLLIGHFLGAESVAVFAIATAIGSLGKMFVGWFGLAFDPHLLGWIASDDQSNYLTKMQLLAPILAAFFAVLSSLAAIWSAPVIDFVYPACYAPSAKLVPLIIFAAALTALSRLGVATAVIAQTPKYYTILYWAALVINIVIGLLLIPTLGVLGAIISTVIAEATILSGWIYLGRIHLNNLPINWRMSIVILLFTLSFIGVFTIQPGVSRTWPEYMLLSMLVISAIMLLLYRAIGRNGICTLFRYARF